MPERRFRRSVRGYDRDQVDAELSALAGRVARLEREAEQLGERVVEKERALQEALGKLRRGGEEAGGQSALRRLDELQAQARRQATKIRMKALQDAVDMAERVAELTRLRSKLGERPGGAGEGAWTAFAGAEPEGEPSESGGEAPPDGLYRERVEVEVGPLADFAQLTGFEDALAGIEGVDEVEVAGFSGGRAAFALSLARPTDVLGALGECAPLDCELISQGAHRIELEAMPAGSPRSRAA